MALLLKKIFDGYFYVVDDLADPRTKDWPLVGKPSHGLSILVLYLMFVMKFGPSWMKNRPPHNLKKILITYNLFQILACTYVFYEGLWYAWGWHYQWFCEPVDHSNSYNALRTSEFVYHYYLLKYVDLLDTVFFILRKKSNQVSFLHLFHHTNVIFLAWTGATYYPTGHGSFICLVNSFVHVVMYGYYLLTITMPSVKNSIWWKKHITQLQIVQLAWCAVHMFALLVKKDCKFPLVSIVIFIPSDLFMLVLFLDFYYRTYIKKAVDKIKKSGDNNRTREHQTANGKKVKGNVHLQDNKTVFQKSI